MKAIWNGATIAESPQEKLIRIEGNWYFPPDSVAKEYLKSSDTHTICFWKGEASYYTVVVEGQENKDAAWYYPQPQEGSVERVGRNFADYVAFWHGVEMKP